MSRSINIPFDDEAELRRKMPNKVELTASAKDIPEPRKRRFITAVKDRAKKRAHAKACAKRNRRK